MEDIIQAFQARRDLLAFLGLSFYKDPNEELLRGLESVVQGLEAIRGLVPDERFQEGVGQLKVFLEQVSNSQDLEAVLRDTATEYAKLFIVPPGTPSKEAPYPYESLFRGKHRMLMDEPRDEVYKAYWTAGLELKQESNEPEDHIGLELLFLARLADRIVDTLGEKKEAGVESALKDIDTSKDFLKAHPMSFSQDLSQLILKSTQHPFYRGLALLLPPFLQFDLDYLQEASEHFSDIQTGRS